MLTTPTVPTLTDAFSALGKVSPGPAFKFSPPPTAPASTPTVPSLSRPSSRVPQMSVIGAPTKSTPAIPQISSPTGGGHIIQPGETLSGIASKYGTDAASLAKLNGIADPNMIKAGATLNIGGSAPATPAVPVVTPPATPPAPTLAGPVTTPSGLSVDPNTGKVLGASSSDATTSAPTGAPGLPALPSGSTNYNPLITSPEYEGALADIKTNQVPTQAEIDAMTQLNSLNTAASKAYTDTQGQPIALPFITGQQAAIQRSQNTLTQPLQAQITLLQAKRQAALTASGTALDAAKEKLSAARDLAKPVSTAMGGTLSRYNPQTGQYETVVNPFGTAGGAGGSDATATIGRAISEGRLTTDQMTKFGIPFILSALQNDPGYNFVTQKAGVASDASSLKTQQDYADTTSRAYETATANFGVLSKFMADNGLNDSTVPLINQLNNKVKAGITDAGTIAAYQAMLQGLRAEYAQVLSRGGQVTEGERSKAAGLIPDDLSPAQLAQVKTQLDKEGANAVNEAKSKVEEIKKRLGTSGSSNSSGSSGGAFGNTSSSGGSSIYDF